MKKVIVLGPAILVVFFLAAFIKGERDTDKPMFIQPSEQRMGDPIKGYNYLLTGDFLKSGIPYDFFIFAHGKGKNMLNREGKNANVDEGFNVVTNADSIDIVIPTCLQCHSQEFDGKLYVGLGNSFADFTNAGQTGKKLALLNMWKTTAPQKYRAVHALLQSISVVNPEIETDVAGVNPADRLAGLLVAHRNPETLEWNDTALLTGPANIVPTDVPAWWLLKKKNAMFYNGMGRGDFGKYLMMSNLLTVKDTSEASEVDSHFSDVLAYIKSLQPPPYPLPVNKDLAATGKAVFTSNCSGCHGTYGSDGVYPNLLIPGSIIKTDSMLYSSTLQATSFIDWFNKSWFTQTANPARIAPSAGYVAPPLDGVWITAPYLHNGSVPTIEAVLNSRLRPKYWSRDLDKPTYNYELVGWTYTVHDAPNGTKVYNTTLPGYGNCGHYFGDKLSGDERKAVIEYLKTL